MPGTPVVIRGTAYLHGGSGGGGGEIDNTLPGGGGDGSPVDPSYGIPESPPGLWPPLFPSNPIVIAPPGTPPGVIWPRPGGGNRPDHTLPGGPPVRPDQGLPGGGGGGNRPDNTLPQQTYWMLCYTPNLGWKYVSVDPSLRPDHTLPGGPPNVPANPIAPGAEPKR